MASKAIQPETISAKLIARWEETGKKIAALAEEFPETKFSYRPVEEARSVAEVLRHVAFWNLYVANSARGEKADDSANELPKEQFTTKKKIVDALRQSTANATAALQNPKPSLSPELAEMVVMFLEHTCEHYGQLVVYARLNGIVPPTSKG
ncbi:MAG TPA: DinB family protein [Candidatus Angelobacter sp.]|nr:DinB family protein [Candidatus Angelobacter sp.]